MSAAQPIARVDAVGLEYGALYRPDAEDGLGGGDWFSVIALPGRRTYLAVGDVIGHGDTGEVITLSEALGDPCCVLVMYTDGLVEHCDGDPRTGIAHLEQAIASWPPEALLDCEALAQQVAPAPHADDLCLLVVRFGKT